MDKKVTFRGMDHSPVIEEYLDNALAKIENYLQNEREPIYLHVVLEAARTHHHHRVEARLKTPHFELYSDYEAPEMYKVIDRVCDVLYRELLNKKKELVDKRKHGAVKRD